MDFFFLGMSLFPPCKKIMVKFYTYRIILQSLALVGIALITVIFSCLFSIQKALDQILCICLYCCIHTDLQYNLYSCICIYFDVPLVRSEYRKTGFSHSTPLCN